MSRPTYRHIGNDEIEDIQIEGGFIRLLAGEYKGRKAHQGDHLPLNYYDIHLEAGAEFVLDTKADDSVMAFTLLGDAVIAGESVEAKTAVKLSDGESLTLKGAEGGSQILVMQSRALHEPVVWGGPIVMNTKQELQQAFEELQNNTFIKEKLDFDPHQG